MGKPYLFFKLAVSIKKRYVFFHFIVISCLLSIPIFVLLISAQPDQLYQRMFPVSMEHAVIEYYDTEYGMPQEIADGWFGVYVFDDLVIYADSNIVLSAPREFFISGELSRPIGEIFSMIAVYNMYIPHFLLPLIIVALVILFVLQLFFYLFSAAFLGLSRLASTRFGYGKRAKIVVMGSLIPALICVAVGFFLPAVHIVLFQIINLLLMFHLSKRYDKDEREHLLAGTS